jgi:hypothetical protein
MIMQDSNLGNNSRALIFILQFCFQQSVRRREYGKGEV